MKLNPKYVVLGISLVIFAAIIHYLSDIVTFVLIAWVLSMIGAPIMLWMKKYIGRNAASFVTLILFLMGFFGLIWFFIPPLVNQVQNLSKIDYGKVVTILEEPIKDWEKWLVDKKLMISRDNKTDQLASNDKSVKESNDEIVLPDSIVIVNDTTQNKNIAIHIHIPKATVPKAINEQPKEPQQFFSFLRSQLESYLNPRQIQAIVNQLLTGSGDILVALFSIFFICFFFLREQGLFADIIKAIVPSVYEAQTIKVIDETSILLIRYFVGIFLQMIIIAILVSSLLLAFGIKNALLIGVFAGILNVIPYIGPAIAAGIAVIITISSHLQTSFYEDLVPHLTTLGIIFLVVRIIDDLLLQPNIFSKSVKAHPLEIFIVVMVGAKLGGAVGMLLAIPFYTAFRVFGKIFLNEFKVIQKLTNHL